MNNRKFLILKCNQFIPSLKNTQKVLIIELIIDQAFLLLYI